MPNGLDQAAAGPVAGAIGPEAGAIGPEAGAAVPPEGVAPEGAGQAGAMGALTEALQTLALFVSGMEQRQDPNAANVKAAMIQLLQAMGAGGGNEMEAEAQRIAGIPQAGGGVPGAAVGGPGTTPDMAGGAEVQPVL